MASSKVERRAARIAYSNQGWDLEGQRELEQADSGYQPQMGARTDYQAGYRESFRVAYREGFDPLAQSGTTTPLLKVSNLKSQA